MGSAGKVDASRAHGEWLRTQRQARGWSVTEMRRRLREAARESGDNLPANDCLSVMIHRWEDDRSGISERYRLHYCKAFQFPVEEFGRPAARPAPPPGGQVPAVAAPAVTSGAGAAPGPGNCLNLGGAGRSRMEQEIVTAARESNGHAQQSERRDAGEATLEHLHAEVTRLSCEYQSGEPLPLFFAMRQTRDQVCTVLDRTLWPRDQSDLFFLLGCLNHLMAMAADGLGATPAAQELSRAGLAYAHAIRSRPLAAQLRLGLAVIALYSGQPQQCLEMAGLGLDQLADGPAAAQLRLVQARAAARRGDTSTTLQAIKAAADERTWDYRDDLTGIGGQFSFSLASHHYYAGSALAGLPGREPDAVTELGRAVELYAAGPQPGEHHSLYCAMIARIDLAATWLRAGQLDAAISVTGPVLDLPVSHRIAHLPKRLATVRTGLAEPRYHGSPAARDLGQQIEQFCRDTITTQLRNLPASPG